MKFYNLNTFENYFNSTCKCYYLNNKVIKIIPLLSGNKFVGNLDFFEGNLYNAVLHFESNSIQYDLIYKIYFEQVAKVELYKLDNG